MEDTLVIEQTKLCCACKEEVKVSLFSINRANKDGLQQRCKSCDNFRQAIRRIEKAGEIQAYSLKYARERRKNPDHRLQMLLNSSKQRAASRNREHSLTLDEIKNLWPEDNKCPVFGFELEWNSAGFRETSPSIDRIDSNKGYTKDNVQIISWKANRIKSNATQEDLEIVAKYMKDKGQP